MAYKTHFRNCPEKAYPMMKFFQTNLAFRLFFMIQRFVSGSKFVHQPTGSLFSYLHKNIMLFSLQIYTSLFGFSLWFSLLFIITLFALWTYLYLQLMYWKILQIFLSAGWRLGLILQVVQYVPKLSQKTLKARFYTLSIAISYSFIGSMFMSFIYLLMPKSVGSYD